ncbi:MAG: HAD hydrolase family protein [Christensenellales bacterium]
MFCCAKIKVAMKNANLQIKKRANFITESNNNSGVARAIEKFVFK